VRTSKNNGLVASMGRVATVGHNAAMESFHALLQKNVLNTQGWETREELRLAIVTGSNAPITIAGVVSGR
jgi:transposase InsO family protein